MTMTMTSWKAPIVLAVSLLWLAASVPHVQAKPMQSDFESMYRIVPRGSNNRRMQDDEEDAILSFDGDLDRIQQLALEEAIRKKNALGNSESPTLSPTLGSEVSSLAPSASLVPSAAPTESSMIPSSFPSQSDMPSDTLSIVPSSAPSHSTMPSDTPSMVPSKQPSAPTTPTDGLDSSTIITCSDVAESKEYMVTWQYSVETAPVFDAQLVVDRLEERLANEMVPMLLKCWDPTVTFDFDVQAIDQQPRDTPSDFGTLF
jgi:hypothetical protein